MAFTAWDGRTTFDEVIRVAVKIYFFVLRIIFVVGWMAASCCLILCAWLAAGGFLPPPGPIPPEWFFPPTPSLLLVGGWSVPGALYALFVLRKLRHIDLRTVGEWAIVGAGIGGLAGLAIDGEWSFPPTGGEALYGDIGAGVGALASTLLMLWYFGDRNGWGDQTSFSILNRVLDLLGQAVTRIGQFFSGLFELGLGIVFAWTIYKIGINPLTWSSTSTIWTAGVDGVVIAASVVTALLLLNGLRVTVGALAVSALSPDTHGKARMATASELRQAGLTPRSRNAIYLGRFLENGRERDEVGYAEGVHLVSIGRTGSGKGTGLIIPNLSTLRRSILIIDPKGEAAAITARKRAQFGRVVMLNPFDLFADTRPWLKSDGFNPLTTVRMDRDNFADDCTIIAQSLVKQEKGGNGRFFSGSAHDLVTALVMHELLTKRGDASLANVRRMLTEEFSVDKAGNASGLAQTVVDMSLSDFEPLRAKATRFKRDMRSNQDVISTAINETAFIDSPPVAHDLASRGGFHFADMKKEIVTVYLVLPATHLESHSNWLRLIIASALRELLATPPSATLPPVLFMLDEFAQLDHLPMIATAMNMTRGYGIQLWPFVQDLTQLKGLYTDRWENFLSASSALTAFAPRDVFTSEYLSRLGGNKTIIVESESERANDSGIGHSRGPQGAPLFRPEELRAMPHGQILCFVEPLKQPFMTRVPGYWETSFNAGLAPNPYRSGS
jgi:type IV secretion system protein VirD4